MITTFSDNSRPSFIVNDPFPSETICEDWYPRYGHIYRGDIIKESTISTVTGQTWPLDVVTFVRWKNGLLYKTNKDGWPLALHGYSFEEAKETSVYCSFYD